MKVQTKAERTRDLLLCIPEHDGLISDWDIQPGHVVVVWWMPGDRTRMVRAAWALSLPCPSWPCPWQAAAAPAPPAATNRAAVLAASVFLNM